jgi:nucleotide-binding universal stress UspA family protein
MASIKRILVPVDFGPEANEAFQYAQELARMSGATLHLLHIVGDVASGAFTEFPSPDLSGIQRSLEQTAKQEIDDLMQMADMADVHPRVTVLTSSNVARAIVDFAEQAQINLIVMGTHGRTPVLRALLGSVADRLVRMAPCPVMIVRGAYPAREPVSPTRAAVEAAPIA